MALAPTILNEYREWMTIDESAHMLSEKLSSTFSPESIYRLALDGYIKLSIYLQSPVWSNKVKIVRLTSEQYFERGYIFLKGARGIYFRDGSVTCCESLFAKSKNSKLMLAEGVHDLSMQGEESFLVETLYCQAAGNPLPAHPTNRPAGIILDTSKDGLVQLLCEINIGSEILSIQDDIHMGRFPPKFGALLIKHYEKKKGITAKHSDYRKILTPKNIFPSDAYLVVRMENLNAFVDKLVSAKKLVKTLTPAEPTDLIKNTLWFVIKLHYGDVAVQNIRRFVDQKNSPMRKDFELAGEYLVSGVTMDTWIGKIKKK